MFYILALSAFLPFAADEPVRADKYFKITVVDADTGRGVPLVELETVSGLRYWTDSNGVVAFQEPGLMDQTVYFYVRSHGYEFPKDGFGFRGKALQVKEGGAATVSLQRRNIAERLYRMTGGGIYADSLLVGDKTPLKEPVLNARVLGSDSVVNAVYHGKIHWFWGDTNRPSYPLGNYQVPGATSLLPAQGGLDPERGVDLSYYVDGKGFAKETAPLPGTGPTWLDGLFVLEDKGKERLFSGYVKIRDQLTVYERGLAEFDDDTKQFKKVAAFDLKSPAYPKGQPFLHRDNGVDYVYFAQPFPMVRVRADAAAIQKTDNYESFTCLKAGTRLEDAQLERDGTRPVYGWKKNTAPTGPAEQAQLVKTGKLKPEEQWLPLRDADNGQAVLGHTGSVYWNEYRQRWVMIAVQQYGTSYLGEVWYAEADTPLGPWVYARKVMTHEKYSFYNPKQHPFFDKEKGKIIYFEGTYTQTFSGNPEKTPRYDYNQLLYKLDLDDARLQLPVAVYRQDERLATGSGKASSFDPRQVAFFALDRAVKGAVAVYEADGELKLDAPPQGKKALFYALPSDAENAPKTTLPLYEYASADGKQRRYATEALEGWRRAPAPLCRVWRNPWSSH